MQSKYSPQKMHSWIKTRLQTNEHIFPDEGSIAEMSEFFCNYQRLTYHLPTFNTHTTLHRNPFYLLQNSSSHVLCGVIGF